MMKQRLLTPGPTPVPEETLLEMAKPVTFHRSAAFRALLQEVIDDLKYIFCTKGTVLALTSSGTGAMEAALANTVPQGGKVIGLISGRWGERWRNLAKAFGVEMVQVTCEYGQAVQPEQLENALKQHPDTQAVFSTLCETATGVRNDVQAFGKILARTPALHVVDAISALGVMECRVDDWHIDICVTGSQKALMLPPGLAFLSVSDKAWAKIDANTGTKLFYFDLKKYRDNIKGYDTPFTPANTLLRALRVSLKQMRAEGIENIWKRSARVAAAARAGVQGVGLELFAQQPADGLTVMRVPDGFDGKTILQKLEKQYGLRFADGQDTLKNKILRLAHMGYIDAFEVLSAIAGLELVLLELGYPVEVGAGVAACQQALASGVKVPQTV